MSMNPGRGFLGRMSLVVMIGLAAVSAEIRGVIDEAFSSARGDLWEPARLRGALRASGVV
jgi:hypothetical protein